MTTPVLTAQQVVEKAEELAKLAVNRPAFQQAASALPGLLRAGINRLRTPKGPLPASPLTESPSRYCDRAKAAPGSAPYFDQYNKQRPAGIPDDATIAAVPPTATDQKTTAGSKVGTDPVVVIQTNGGLPLEGVPVRFVICLGQATIATAVALTGANGRASAGEWKPNSKGNHALQATAGPLALMFKATAT